MGVEYQPSKNEKEKKPEFDARKRNNNKIQK